MISWPASLPPPFFHSTNICCPNNCHFSIKQANHVITTKPHSNHPLHWRNTPLILGNHANIPNNQLLDYKPRPWLHHCEHHCVILSDNQSVVNPQTTHRCHLQSLPIIPFKQGHPKVHPLSLTTKKLQLNTLPEMSWLQSKIFESLRWKHTEFQS